MHAFVFPMLCFTAVAWLCTTAATIAPEIPTPIPVGDQHDENALYLDVTVLNVNFRMFWTAEDDETIRQEAYSIVCPDINKYLGVVYSCDKVVTFTLETLLYKRQWGAAEYGMRYMDCVYEAIHNDEFFSVFKSDFRYKNIVESLKHDRAIDFLRYTFDRSPDLFYNEIYYERVRSNDLLGAPDVVQYALPSDVEVEGSTEVTWRESGNTIIRYIKVVSDLQHLMNILQDDSIRSIAEIGIGFGGQAQVDIVDMI